MNPETLFVTAFLDLREDRSKNRPFDACVRHFTQLANTGIPLLLFLSSSFSLPSFPNVTVVPLELEDLWTYQQIPTEVRLPLVRTAHHDTRPFLGLMNCKLELVSKAAALYPDKTHLAWIDFNVGHVFRSGGYDRLRLIAQSALRPSFFAIPGCWSKGTHLESLFKAVNWRFCGGFFLTSRDCVEQAYSRFQKAWPGFLQAGLTWEVNTWALLEQQGWAPTWFQGNHDDSLVALPSTFFSAVACLTTIPSRLQNGTCTKAINSLIHQADHVYLAIAERYQRFPDQEVSVPAELLSEEPYKSKLTVVTMEDKGPASKYLVSLSPLVKNKWVFTGDDDQEYADGLLDRMLSSVTEMAVYQNRAAAIRANTTGGMIHGYVGNLMHSSLLRGLEGFELPVCARFTDDQWMSIYFYLNSIPIRGTGIEEYKDLYKAFLDGHEQYSTDALATVGNRDQKVREVTQHFRVRFIHDGQVMRVLTDVGQGGRYTYPVIEGFEPSSSSFVRFEGQNYMNVRYVNYSLTPVASYIIRDPKGHLKTQNVLMKLSDTFEIQSSTQLIVQTELPTFCEDIQGLEDIRLFDGGGGLQFIATQRQYSPSRQNRMVVGAVSYLGTHQVNLEVVEPPTPTGCEKNWIPLGGNRFIYQWHPLQIGTVKKGRLVIDCEWPTPTLFEGIRGSTIFQPFGSELLGLVHHSEEGWPRKYYHRLVVLDKAYKPLGISYPFTFGRIGVEFCIGMALEGEGRVRFWYSQHDRDPAWVSVPLDIFVFVPCT